MASSNLKLALYKTLIRPKLVQCGTLAAQLTRTRHPDCARIFHEHRRSTCRRKLSPCTRTRGCKTHSFPVRRTYYIVALSGWTSLIVALICVPIPPHQKHGVIVSYSILQDDWNRLPSSTATTTDARAFRSAVERHLRST